MSPVVALWVELNVIEWFPPFTPPTASNVPSDAGGSGGFARAAIWTEPPATIDAPPVMSADAVGLIDAFALKVETLRRPPVALKVLASASFELTAVAVT